LPETDSLVTDVGGVGVATAAAARVEERDPNYYGWRVVAAACFGVMGGFGSLFVYTFAIFVKPLNAQFGWSREAISLGFGLAAITLGLTSPVLGRLIDRFGPRRIILPSVMVFGCGIASLALLRSGVWQFYVTCILIGLVGNGAAHLAYARSISSWFQQRLGTALAFVMLGAGLGSMILPLVAQGAVSHSGWRAAYASLGGLALLLGFPLSWRYIREREHEQGRERGQERGPMRAQSEPAVHSGITWQEGLRSYTFWIIVAILFASSISMNGTITHLSALLTDRGVRPGDAALCASVLGASSILAAGPLLWRVGGVGRQPHHGSWNISAGLCERLRRGSLFCGADWDRSGRRSGDHTVFVDTVLWPARIFHAVWIDVDVLCSRRSHGSRDSWPCLRFDRVVHVATGNACGNLGHCRSNESVAAAL